MEIKFATISKTGNRRNNEDSFEVIEMPEQKRWMGIVCDGMGGHAHGEIASETVCSVISDYWKEHVSTPDCVSKVTAACKKASHAMDLRTRDLHHTQMGTTMVMASVESDVVTIAHIGDSRCYLQRQGEGLVYQTKDHIRLDFGWEVVAKCFFSYRPDVAIPDVVQFRLLPGDRILLCSDGIYKSIAPDILQAMMMEAKPLEEILAGFDMLCEKQGDDNYTAVLMEATNA